MYTIQDMMDQPDNFTHCQDCGEESHFDDIKIVVKNESDPVKESYEQYRALKGKYPDRILLIGDATGTKYQFFCEDARLAAELLGLILVHRVLGYGSDADRVPYAFIAKDALDGCLPKLIRENMTVAIADPLNY